MQYELVLDKFPAGYAMDNASGKEGDLASIVVREFTSSEDGDLFVSRLEGLPNELLARAPGGTGIPPSMVDHLIAVIRPDLRTTVYVNHCRMLVHARFSRKVKVGEPVFKNDIVDIDRLEFEGVEFTKGSAVLCILSAGWRKGMFFDFAPLVPGQAEGSYDIQKLLGAYLAYLENQGIFRLNQADWQFLLEHQWFPFVTLGRTIKAKIVAFAKGRDDVDRLLPEIAADVRRRLSSMFDKWSDSRLFSEHLDLIRHAAKEFEEGDYVSCSAILYPRIEGLLRSLHEFLGVTEKASQKVLSSIAVSENLKQSHQFSWLLPEMFRRYLEEVYFRDFEPGKPAKLSRHSVGHGVASIGEFNLKGACIGFLILDQLFYLMPVALGD